MKKNRNILLLSDSHGHSARIRQAVERTQPDCLLFAGDGLRDIEEAQLSPSLPVYAVRGNSDALWLGCGAHYPEEQIVTLDGVRILLTHGHTLGVKSGLERAISRAATAQADVLVFGHTHGVFECTVTPGGMGAPTRALLVCNPGSIGMYPHSFGTLTLRDGQVLFGYGTL